MINYTQVTKAHYYLSGGKSNSRLKKVLVKGRFTYWQNNKNDTTTESTT